MTAAVAEGKMTAVRRSYLHGEHVTTPVTGREPSERSGGKASTKNARYSAWARAKRPEPTTRAEADEIFAPRAHMARAGASRLARLLELGLLELRSEPGPIITQGEAHQAILDALYPE